jgi:hypothetical protein
MINVNYGEFNCEYFRKEILNAENDLAVHKISDVVRNTGSEHYILRLLKAVREGKLRTDEISIQACGRKIDIDIKGEFIQPWPDDLFEADFYLRFDIED